MTMRPKNFHQARRGLDGVLVELLVEEGSRHTVEAFRYASRQALASWKTFWLFQSHQSINLIMGGGVPKGLYPCQYKSKFEILWNMLKYHQNIFGHILILLDRRH